MPSIKDLRKTAELERTKAGAEQQAAQARRDAANRYDGQVDPMIPIKENDRAQMNEDHAQQHTNAADELERQASALRSKVVQLEAQKQEKQKSHQVEIDRIDAEIRQLKGE